MLYQFANECRLQEKGKKKKKRWCKPDLRTRAIVKMIR